MKQPRTRSPLPTAILTKVVAVALATLPMLAAPPAEAQGTSAKSTASEGKLASKDRKFLEEAAASGMLEIQASKLALQHAVAPEVKQFAEHMVMEHTAVDKQLSSLATAKGVKPPTELPMLMKRKVDALGKEKGKDFDEEYVEEIGVDAHQDTVKLFEKAAKDVEDPEVKKFAADTLPSLQKHLQMAQALDRKMEEAEKASKKK